ncbi:MAG: class II glutamine amidotransferase [Acidianus infernus]|uniref:class II glutamine amidotransferase n=1 Tax=Acidianus infernus TaxID=12915 RepID=UPI002274EF23|nr:class II glutamine amidotransferase [Acidianus infernus]
MCRMFAYVGDSKEELTKLYEALKESAKNDIIASKYGLNPVHGDGWGYVIYDGERIYFYKSKNPIFNESLILPSIEGKFYAIFHARQATDKSTVSARFAHPFYGDDENYFYFFAHNGSVDKEKLAQVLNFQGQTTIDSELALKFLIKNGLDKGIDLLMKDYTKSALNVFILRISRSDGSAELYYVNYYTRKDRSEYYKFYKNENAVFSSTLAYYGIRGVEVEEGKLLRL